MMFSALLSASVMMTLVGLTTWLIVRTVSIKSWRLRSLLAVVVLAQGAMFFRLPLHLGLVETAADVAPSSKPDFYLPLPQSTVAKPSVSTPLLATAGDVQYSTLAGVSSFIRQHHASLLAVIWFAVVATMLSQLVWRYSRLLSLVRQLEPAPNAWQESWRCLLKQSRNVRDHRCQMRVSGAIGPMLVRHVGGYTLVVPEDYWRLLSDDQRRGVMLHELAHWERRDVWNQLVMRVVATLHWFNPAAWWALREYEMAAESACDARVKRDGKRASAGFASALVDLMQWHADSRSQINFRSGIGFQSMAAPPLSARVNQLLQPNAQRDSIMKRLAMILFVAPLVAVSFVQIHLTSAQDASAAKDGLQVMDAAVESRMRGITTQLDQADPTTNRFAELFDTPSGKIAIAGMLNTLQGQAREQARGDAIPRFINQHFTKDASGKYVAKESSAPALQRWLTQANRLGVDAGKMKVAMEDIAGKLDTSTEVGSLFQRLLRDPQAAVAVRIGEMNGGDVVTRFIADSLGKILVDQGNGTFVVVESRRADAERLTGQFELAAKIDKRLQRELPILANEYVATDENHQEFVRYLKNPITATVVAIQLAEDHRSVGAAVDQLHEHLEVASRDTAKGLEIVNDSAWEQLQEIFRRVDRSEALVVRVQERLSEVADTLSTDDEVSAKLATHMRGGPAAVRLAAELPYADADAGEEFRALISAVLVESGGKFSVNQDRTDELTEKSRELLQVCRQGRRYAGENEMELEGFADQGYVKQLGEFGRYTLLDEVRRFAERHQPDPIDLLQEHVLQQTENGKLRIRDDRREVVRKLVEQSEKVRAEAGNDDF
ncbi:MAG: M56 family metallopeptidase [Rubripirellula sp.]